MQEFFSILLTVFLKNDMLNTRKMKRGEKMENAATVYELKNNNRKRILEQLRFGALSRAEISRRVGLAKSSVTVLTNEMIKEGLIFEAGVSKKETGAGRTAILLKINKNFGFSIGINLHRKSINVAAVDMLCNSIFSFKTDPASYKSDKEAINDIKKEILTNIKTHGLDINNCVGIGIASPGPLNYEKGVILNPPKFSLFNNYPIVKELKKQFNLPVFLENNSVSLALYEHYQSELFGNTLFVVISEGVGSTLLINGEVYRGAHGLSGEIGHISINSKGEKCPCGNSGCLELYVTASALIKRFKFKDLYALIDKWEVGDKKALKVLDFLTETLGTALTTATNLYDLDNIVLFGEYSYKGEMLTAFLEDYIKTNSITAKAHNVTVTNAATKQDNAAVASALSALNNFYNFNMEFKK